MSDSEIRYFSFFENWFIMAEGRDTDSKRLAFYDTIMRYAFEGKVPDRPVKGVSRGEDWAAWDAYNATRPIIDKILAKIKAGRKGGRAGFGVSRNEGNQNAAIAEQKQNNSKTIAENNSKSIAHKNKNMNRNENMNMNENKETISLLEEESKKEEKPQRKKPEWDKWFAEFWKKYPSSCPRKTDKAKCLEKFTMLLKNAGGGDKDRELFDAIMAGLDKWMSCDLWTSDDGQYIRAPLVWLNNSNWEDEPRKGGNGNGNRPGTANATFKDSDSDSLF